MSAKPTPVYPFQFQMVLGELLEQNARYKLNVLDGQIKIDQRQKDLDLAKADLDQSGLHAQFRLKALGKDIESLNVSKTALTIQKDSIRYRIEPLLERVLSFFDDIYFDFSNNRLPRSQYANYLRAYKELLHQGNALGLECYNKYPVINRINSAIEKFIN